MQKSNYKLGDMYSSNFDYDGMLQMGLKVEPTDSLPKLQSLFDSMEDVNYHTASGPLWSAIVKLKNGNTNIDAEITEFKKLVELEVIENQS